MRNKTGVSPTGAARERRENGERNFYHERCCKSESVSFVVRCLVSLRENSYQTSYPAYCCLFRAPGLHTVIDDGRQMSARNPILLILSFLTCLFVRPRTRGFPFQMAVVMHHFDSASQTNLRKTPHPSISFTETCFFTGMSPTFCTLVREKRKNVFKLMLLHQAQPEENEKYPQHPQQEKKETETGRSGADSSEYAGKLLAV